MAHKNLGRLPERNRRCNRSVLKHQKAPESEYEPSRFFMPAQTNLNKASAMVGQPEPPIGYSAAEKTIWNAVVTSRPASAWTPADLMLISLYVSAVADVQRLDREIDRHGEIEAGKVSPLVKLRDMRETRLIQVAARLKLLPSNRYDAKTVARLGQHASKASRALAAMEADDLLGGAPRKGRLQ